MPGPSRTLRPAVCPGLTITAGARVGVIVGRGLGGAGRVTAGVPEGGCALGEGVAVGAGVSARSSAPWSTGSACGV